MKLPFLTLVLFILFNSSAALAQKYVPSFPPPELLTPGKVHHFEGEKNGLKISLDLKRKTVMSVRYSFIIEYPDKRIVKDKGIVYMVAAYDMGSEELLKESTGTMMGCISFFPKRHENLEISIGPDEDENGNETGKIFVSFLFFKDGYPDINLNNTPELVED